MSTEAVIVAAARTPIGKLGGALAEHSATALGARVISALIERSGIDPAAVSEVIMGQVLTAACGQNPARQAARMANLPDAVPAVTVNMVCGAGQKSIHLAAQAIQLGDADIVVAGGQDSMTQAPYAIDVRRGVDTGTIAAVDTMVKDGLWDAFNNVSMGETAEVVAQRCQVTRVDQDVFALASQRKAASARANGAFAKEIVPVVVEQPETHVVAEDEHPRPDTTMESLAALGPVFRPHGSVTAGNSSGVNDGAAAVLMMSRARAEALGIAPLARVAAYASAGVDPMLMGLGPVPASRLGLGKAGWTVHDLDLVELNEAFAAQSVAVNREMGWDPECVNVNGGAIALGHPLAASGCRIAVTLLHEMVRRNARRGLATMCIGGGLGVALCLERD